MSPARRQVVEPARSDATVEKALVVVFPTNVWSWEAPGRRGATIGSSGARWLKPHTLMKLTPRSSAIDARLPSAAAGGSPPAHAPVTSTIATNDDTETSNATTVYLIGASPVDAERADCSASTHKLCSGHAKST